jgi:hypothetical protein
MRYQNINIPRAAALVTCSWLAACSGDSTRVVDPRGGMAPDEGGGAAGPRTPSSSMPGGMQPAGMPPAGMTPAGSSGGSPFKSLAAAANAPDTFAAPRAGVPLAGDAVAFIASLSDASATDANGDELGPRSAVFLQLPNTAPRVLYAGGLLVSPLDIEASRDGSTLYVADYAGGADGGGAILALPAQGGEATALAAGWSPRSVTLGADDRLYFSGIDPESGEPGVFALSGDAVTPVFRGAPLVDPSGIAVFGDGRVLVADTRLFDASVDSGALDGEAGVVLLDDGAARVFASGFATGFPAGIALSMDEGTLIISGQGPDRSDTVYLVDVAHPEQKPSAVTAAFSVYQDSSAGLKRAHGSNTFIWASLSADGGTVFKIEG